ncbi:MAG TPA: hypothetical protein VKP65_03815 [Rhodothermales bacterium]|nr:hypothetical protein [Rhodothermales bacterium]
MKTKHYKSLIHLLALALLFCAVVPCDLIELAAVSSGTEPPFAKDHVFKSGSTVDESGGELAVSAAVKLVHVDCCAGCLMCCTSYTETQALGLLTLSGTTKLKDFFMAQAPLGSPLSIWRPPRI